MAEASPSLGNFTIQHFAKTQEGMVLIESMKPFCLGGDVWQGIRGGGFALCDERVLTDEEVEELHDVDGRKDRLMLKRSGRLESRRYRKDMELEEREQKKREKRLANLRLAQLEREVGITPEDANASVQLTDTPEPEPVASIQAHCGDCGKLSPEGHKNPDKWLVGHRMGSHKKK